MTDAPTPPDIYPMPSFATLSVRHLAASAKWYRDVLGFQHVFTIPGPEGALALVHLRWARYADLLLRQEPAAPPAVKGVGVTLTFNLIEGGTVDTLAGRARAHGVPLLSEPANRPWNVRDFSVADPDGFVLVFSQGPVDPDAGMDDIVGRSARS